MPWLLHQDAASTVFPDPAGPLSSVSGQCCSSRVSRPISRGRGTVPCAGSGAASLESSSPVPWRPVAAGVRIGAAAWPVDTLVMGFPLGRAVQPPSPPLVRGGPRPVSYRPPHFRAGLLG